uniref:Leucine-rich repeat-containing protein 57 n=1 Tax=Steinernema glaseri TaxID=37863 RepID=A0A1I7YZT4_9BILA
MSNCWKIMGNDSSKTKSGGSSDGTGYFKSSSSVVQKHMETAKKSRVLQLKAVGLKKIPSTVEEVADILRNLDLAHNKIREIPIFIGAFSSLKQLHLSENLIEELPDELGCLKKLEVLNVSNNKLHSLPETIVACSALSRIELANNNFTVFPVALCLLQSLDVLDLSSNKIETLPDQIGELKASELILNQNRLRALNDNLMNCARLKILRVQENCLSADNFSDALLRNSTISLINFEGNMFQESEFQRLPGYEAYQDRFTAIKKKGI